MKAVLKLVLTKVLFCTLLVGNASADSTRAAALADELVRNVSNINEYAANEADQALKRKDIEFEKDLAEAVLLAIPRLVLIDASSLSYSEWGDGKYHLDGDWRVRAAVELRTNAILAVIHLSALNVDELVEWTSKLETGKMFLGFEGVYNRLDCKDMSMEAIDRLQQYFTIMQGVLVYTSHDKYGLPSADQTANNSGLMEKVKAFSDRIGVCKRQRLGLIAW